jgi:peptidoglycan/LPS O-acetylase OafA/YrhL
MQPRLIFHTFNALRFFAFFRVFLLHIPFLRQIPLPEGNQFLHTLIFDGGEIGVDFFFVLSGFLITWLLVQEQADTGTINIKNYFLRRSLRIWPLYYAGVLIAFTNNFLTSYLDIGNNTGYDPNPIFSLTFLENYQMVYHDITPNGAPLRVLWSVCVEEHFYVLWLLLFLLVPLRHFIKAAGILWIIGILYRHWFYFQFPHLKDFYDYDVISKMDYFSAGGISGYLMATRSAQVKLFLQKLHPYNRYAFTILVIAFFFTHQFYIKGRVSSIYLPILSATLFSGFLLVVATSSTFLHISERHIFSRLGRISYGLYVFHTVVILTLLVIAARAGTNTMQLLFTGYGPYIFAFVALLLTIAISYLSWRYFESYFLRLKERLAQKKRSVPEARTP